MLEGAVAERVGGGGGEERARPAWWSTALTLGHLETRLHAARALESPQEYKMALLVYAKKIADEGFRAKAEELVKELFGPIFWYVCARLVGGEVLTCVFGQASRARGRFVVTHGARTGQTRLVERCAHGLW